MLTSAFKHSNSSSEAKFLFVTMPVIVLYPTNLIAVYKIPGQRTILNDNVSNMIEQRQLLNKYLHISECAGRDEVACTYYKND